MRPNENVQFILSEKRKINNIKATLDDPRNKDRFFCVTIVWNL